MLHLRAAILTGQIIHSEMPVVHNSTVLPE